MEKVGRRRDGVWERVTLVEGGWKCNDCGEEFAGGASRIKAHLNKLKDKGIRPCTGKANLNNDMKDNLQHSQDHGMSKHKAGQIQADDAEDLEMTQDLQMMKYAFECLRPEDKVIVSPLSYLTQEEFITLKPETSLDSLVIDTFVEILTDIERKTKMMPLNWYLPVTFSDAALKGKVGYFLKFVHCQKMKENYMSDLKSCDKIFIPVHVGVRQNGHFYLNIIHLKNEEIEIWDSLPNPSVAEREETANQLLSAMEKLFEEVTFTKFRTKMADDNRLQPNGFDCGVFVINYMQQSDTYVKRDSSFELDSQKEREDLALKLLNSDLNKEKKNLYDKARRHFAQVEKQDNNKRLRVDSSEENFEDDDSYEDDDSLEDNMTIDSDESYDGWMDALSINNEEVDHGLENDLIGQNFRRYTKQIMEWIEDDKVSTIVVWGTGGSGKTALASHIYDKLSEKGDIKVIWVTVSQNSIYKLQKIIARSIKLDISEEFEVKIIARKLSQAFQAMKRCVVILDDVWDHFFFKEVGFPMSDNQIRFILTTRIPEVCQGMGCDQKNIIKVESLDMHDSWALFKKTVGSYEGLSLEVKRIAQNVAYQCKGLPLAIVRIATSMKGKKQVGEWNHMLECLENLGHGQYEMDKWVFPFPVLRSSYDFLSKKLQRFFLYCALSTKRFLDDNKADHLMRRFVYESIDETKTLRVQYNEGYDMLDRLNNHSMLEINDELHWRMNKFLRALAIGIAEDTGKIMANAYKNLTEIPRDDQWKDDLQKVFLTGNMIKTIPNGTCPRCSLLSALFLDRNTYLKDISDDFFNNMPALKILDLSKTEIKCLPKSVSSLKCLNALLLLGCKKLSYIPPLRNLKWLISFDLSDTAITEAPEGLDSLVNLRCLNLYRTHVSMSASLISKLINLEYLLGLKVTEACIQGLDNLEVIEAYFHDISVFNTCLSFLNKHCVLRSYHLILHKSSDGPSYKQINTKHSMKRITFEDMDLRNREAVLPGDIKDLVIRDCQLVKKVLVIDDCLLAGTVRSCLFSVVSFYGHNNNNTPHEIERLDIIRCEDVECLCCFSDSCPFCSSSQLVGCLYLSFLTDLKHIVSPDALLSLHQPSLFSHLTDLKISNCHSMETLMTPKLLALLQNLRTIDVNNCLKMKEIVGEDDHSKMELGGSGDLSHPTLPITLPKLTSLHLWSMPQLKFIYRGVMLCPSLQTSDGLLSLHQPSRFSHLTDLVIFNCDSVETLMTPKLLALLQNLRTIDVSFCGKMKEIVGEDDHSKMELGGSGDLSHPTLPITLPRLTSMKLEFMPQLKFIYRGVMLCPSLQTPDALLSLHQPSLFSHLTDLKISNCHSMETLMTPKLLALLQNLRTIDVDCCRMMKEIVGEDDHSKMELGGSGDLSHPTPITLPRLTSMKLYNMPQLKFIYRGVMLCPSLQTSDGLLSLHQPSLFSHLTDLKISYCHSMETLMTPKLLALLQNLRTIDVDCCRMMKEIVGEDDHSKMELGGSGDLSHPTPITLPRLTSLKLYYMPQLKFIYRGVMLCPSLQTPDALLSLHQPSLFSHLTDLKISNCDSMETLLTPKLLALLQNLRTIDVYWCRMMKEIVGEDDHSKMELGGSGDLSHPTPITLPRLTSLKLKFMPLLKFIYRGVMLCPSLQTFFAHGCGQLNRPQIEISNGCELPMEKTSTGYRWGIKTD